MKKENWHNPHINLRYPSGKYGSRKVFLKGKENLEEPQTKSPSHPLQQFLAPGGSNLRDAVSLATNIIPYSSVGCLAKLAKLKI